MIKQNNHRIPMPTAFKNGGTFLECGEYHRSGYLPKTQQHRISSRNSLSPSIDNDNNVQ